MFSNNKYSSFQRSSAVCAQRCSEVACLPAYSTTTPPRPRSPPPGQWCPSRRATAMRRRDTAAPDRLTRPPARGRTCPASCRCCYAPSRTRRRRVRGTGGPGTAHRARTARVRRPWRRSRVATSWASRTSANWRPACSSAPSSGHAIFPSSPTSRYISPQNVVAKKQKRNRT